MRDVTFSEGWSFMQFGRRRGPGTQVKSSVSLILLLRPGGFFMSFFQPVLESVYVLLGMYL